MTHGSFIKSLNWRMINKKISLNFRCLLDRGLRDFAKHRFCYLYKIRNLNYMKIISCNISLWG